MTPTPEEAVTQINQILKDDALAFEKHWASLLSSFNTNEFQVALKTAMIRGLLPLIGKLQRCELDDYKDAVLEELDLGAIYSGVDERSAEQEKLKKEGKLEGHEYGYQEFIVLELLKWYKHSFFKWVNTPEVPGKTGGRLIGHAHPNTEERAGDASVTEVYQFEDGTMHRFPRYNDTKRLLKWRQGRCGEWNICFYQILRALDIKTRYIWNAEDHVWLEMYSKTWGRWVHIDSCEESFDNPSLYNKGWGKKMSYCLAISLDGVRDVTKRYVVDSDKQLPRTTLSEGVLKRLLISHTLRLRKDLPIDTKVTLRIQDYFEDLELNGNLTPTKTKEGPAIPRQTGAGEWTNARGEDGN